MRPQQAQILLAHLRRLASNDGARLASAKDRIAAAEEEMAAARAEFGSASTRAEISQRVAQDAEQLLPHTQDAEASTPHAPTDPDPDEAVRSTIADEILASVRARRRASRQEITDHIRAARPDIKPGGLGPELTRLVREGMLARVARGVYEISPPPDGSGA
jgi:DNA invertase Pin-like site-specific DNA recombinase